MGGERGVGGVLGGGRFLVLSHQVFSLIPFSNTGPHISSNIYFLSLPLITLSFELLK